MRGWWATIITIAFLALTWMLVSVTEVQSACIMSYCKDSAPQRTYVRNRWESGRQIKGDLYRPGPGKRTQIRDNSRRIIGHIEVDGSVTNITRQKIGKIDD